MELQFTPGLAKDEFVQDAMPGYLDELERNRKMLDSRYDDQERQGETPQW